MLGTCDPNQPRTWSTPASFVDDVDVDDDDDDDDVVVVAGCWLSLCLLWLRLFHCWLLLRLLVVGCYLIFSFLFDSGVLLRMSRWTCSLDFLCRGDLQNYFLD